MEAQLRTIYRVTNSWLQRLLGRGLFMTGDLPHAWSEDHARLFVATEAAERATFSSLEKAVSFAESRMACAEYEEF